MDEGDTHDNMPFAPTDIGSAMNSQASLNETFERFVLVARYALNSTDTFDSTTTLAPTDDYAWNTPKIGISNLPTLNKLIPFPHAWIITSKPVQSKIKYHSYFRGTLVIKITCNNLPTTSGKVWFFVDMFPQLTGSRAVVREGGNPGGELTRYTGCHGVEFDFSSARDVIFEVPFISPQAAFSLIEDEPVQIALHCISLTPVRSATTQSVDLNVYASYKDVQLGVPTPKDLAPSLQSKEGFAPSEEAVRKVRMMTGVDTEQQDKSLRGLAAGLTGSVRSMASEAGSKIHGILKTPLTWATKIAQGAASTVGLSKPLSIEAVKPYVNVPAKGYTQTENLDTSVRLGPVQDGGVTVDSKYGLTEDEMDIGFAVSKYQYLYRNAISVNDDKGTIVRKFPVSPMLCDLTTLAGADVMHVTNTGFVASLFEFWKGMLSYRFAFAKTKNHSARIRVTWFPGSTSEPTDEEVLESHNFPTAHTRIYELKEDCSEIYLDIPYINIEPMLRTTIPYVSTDFQLGCNGWIVVEIENELRSSNVVADTIDMLIYMKGGKDLQFYYPSMNKYCPMYPNRIDEPTRNIKPMTGVY